MAKGKSKTGSGKGKKPTRKAAKAKKPAARKPAAKKKAVAPKPVARPTLRRPVKNRASVVRMPSARPAPHKAPSLSANIYERDLDKTPANYAPLTPLQFIERSAAVYPDNIALIHGARRQSWAETYARCRRLASALDKVGIGVGDTVAIMAPNIPEMYEAHFGVPMTGGVLNSLNTRLDAAMIAFILDHSETKVLLVDREFHKVMTEALAIAKVQPLVVDIDDPLCEDRAQIGDTTYEEFHRRPAMTTTPGNIRPTNGTRSRSTTRRARPAIPRAWSTAIAARRCRPTATPRNGRWACIRSISGPCRCSIATAGASRGRWRWSPAPRSACAAPTPRRSTMRWPTHNVTHMCGAPIIMQFIIGATPAERQPLARKVEFMTAAAPPPAAVLEALEKENFRVTHVYGLTEVYGPATICSWHEEWDARPSHERAQLKARQGVRYAAEDGVTVMDPTTMKEVPRDGATMGEVMFRGNLTMKGYLKNAKATREAFEHGWFHSGDLGVLHEDGYIELRDRSKDIIISGGENISTIEVEGVIIEHPAVANVAVVAKPDEKWGETPCAFVMLKPGAAATAEDIIAHCRANLASYKCPRHVVFRDLPMTSTGKVQKFVLREWAKQV